MQLWSRIIIKFLVKRVKIHDVSIRAAATWKRNRKDGLPGVLLSGRAVGFVTARA